MKDAHSMSALHVVYGVYFKHKSTGTVHAVVLQS